MDKMLHILELWYLLKIQTVKFIDIPKPIMAPEIIFVLCGILMIYSQSKKRFGNQNININFCTLLPINSQIYL